MPKRKTPLRFPDEILVHREDPGDGDLFMVADPNLRAHADLDSEVEVGVYTLHHVARVKTRIEVD